MGDNVLVLILWHIPKGLPTITSTTKTNDLEFGVGLVIWTRHSENVDTNVSVILSTENPVGSCTVTVKVGTRDSGSDTKGGHTNERTKNNIEKFQLNECNEYEKRKTSVDV